MRWHGWGIEEHATTVPPHVADWLAGRLGGPLPSTPRAAARLEDVRLPEPSLPPAGRAALVTACGEDGVRADRASRVVHAAGRSYPDLLRLRDGDAGDAPDAVVLPASHDQVRAVLDACAAHGIAVVPFGGGTSVVGGVQPLRGSLSAVVALDLERLAGVEHLDVPSQIVTAGGGTAVADLERTLATQGLTLGHLPQSFEHVSVGGSVATRSAGQASTGYGRIDEQVVGLRCATPAGDLDLRPMPATAAGPSLLELVIGSEGTLGVITSVALRVHAAPAVRRYEAVMLPGLEAGLGAVRALVQQDAAADVMRLSDPAETVMLLAQAGAGGARGAALDLYLRARGVAEGCLVILGWEGTAEAVRARREASLGLLRRHDAAGLGAAPGRAWERGRFHGPYLRDALMDRGVLVDTLETAAPWSALPALHRAVDTALHEHAPVVGCHVSHLYATGASLYFTFLARRDDADPLGQWWAAKTAATDAIVAAGGTITHHHAVGRDHAPWLSREVGATGVAALRALKRELDPAGIMNPGKLADAA
jgi:alkyldihydroxyacetonephosphate synthase